MKQNFLSRKYFHTFLYAWILLGSLAFLVFFGIIGMGRPGHFSADGAVFYAAGRAWLSGMNPYDHADLIASVANIPEIDLTTIIFAYPPQSAALCLGLALLSYPVAKIIWLGINLASIAGLIWLTIHVIEKQANQKISDLSRVFIAAAIIANPFTNHVIWLGQSSLLAIATTMAAWVSNQRRQWILAGIFLGFASFKPQLCILLILWFVLQQRWQILGVAALTASILSFYPLLFYGPLGMFIAWYDGIQEGYKGLVFNQIGFQHLVGVESLLAVAGFKVVGLKFLAILSVGILWQFRQKINLDDVLGILMALTFTFVGYSHDYDYVGLIPLFASLFVYSLRNSTIKGIAIASLISLCVPQRIVRVLENPLINHWRTLLVIGLLFFLLWLSAQNRKKSQALLQPDPLSTPLE